ncbi:MFS transporter [Sulfobacillus thermosulfidooxidans]|uniref:Drug resistance transporter, EmrB/QacA subfamily n=1 Tax=Sulfobacillus thermosulfidooxidans (strain DSM 9293 / VKM B-1269 / AT-1) TaxID=929705 RepID=A0A1W1WHM3_SULTA|nr:MFS transporter [Sulfobacillus thermosulfidooxidans]OLZ08052.1 multidrug MFS transporter [Sulfobacillus thermosulfidooxidans]OLZ16466.1 multidrug MFS transporter [Sulfobacillus thermosulfidooxidans]OLZ19553.1 multidrug MFS transporter [Sulfobacillus thermosulfidooxidans]SMC05649.1 drug resistance transporter, EmrB/QacA subfamily [Sulfobacillus thermosulfidooxidans DSM 9293]
MAKATGIRSIWHSMPLTRFTTRENYIWLVVSTVCIGAFMAALDASIVNVALPDMSTYFNASASLVSWVLIAYLLTLTTLLTLFGRLADMLGRRPLYTFGFLVFIVGSAACGAAVNLPMLIVSRVFQAAGAAMLQANSVAIITATVPPSVRGRAIGFQGSAQAIGLSLGPAIGGGLIALFGWRAIFYVNVPVGLIGTAMAAMILPKDKLSGKKTTFDWWGTLFMTPFLVLVMMALTEGMSWGWGSPRILGMFAGALFFLLAFIWRELKFRAPLVDMRLFKIPVFSIGNFTGLLSYLAMFGVLFLMPFYFERVLNFDSAVSGLILTAVPLGMTVAAPKAGALADRYGPRLLTTGGMALTGLAIVGLAWTVAIHASLVPMIIELILVGAGLGIFTPPNNSSVMGSLPSSRLGVGGGILNMARSLGMAMGTAISGTIMATFLALNGGVERAGGPKGPWIPATRYALYVLVALSLLASLLSVFRVAAGEKSTTVEKMPLEW